MSESECAFIRFGSCFFNLVLRVYLFRVEQDGLEDQDQERSEIVVEGDEAHAVELVNNQVPPVDGTFAGQSARLVQLGARDTSHVPQVVKHLVQFFVLETQVVFFELILPLLVVCFILEVLLLKAFVQSYDLDEVTDGLLHVQLTLMLLHLRSQFIFLALVCSSLPLHV